MLMFGNTMVYPNAHNIPRPMVKPRELMLSWSITFEPSSTTCRTTGLSGSQEPNSPPMTHSRQPPSPLLEIGEMVISAFIGLVGLGPASRVFTFHLLDSPLTTTTNMSICPHMTSYSNSLAILGQFGSKSKSRFRASRTSAQ